MIHTASIPYGWQDDGILSFIGRRNDLAEFILGNPTPAVEISLVRADIDLPRVAADNPMIGQVAAAHFIERGFRRCLWVSFRDDVPNRERATGFAKSSPRPASPPPNFHTTAWAAGRFSPRTLMAGPGAQRNRGFGAGGTGGQDRPDRPPPRSH